MQALLVVIYLFCFFFFFNDTATTEIYTLSLHDALPIWLDELYDLTAMFPDGNKLLLSKLTTKPNPSVNTRNSRFAALMDLEGFATNDNKPMLDLRAALSNDGYAIAGIMPKSGTTGVRGVNRLLFNRQWF